MDNQQSKMGHKNRIVQAIAMAIQFAALLCPSLKGLAGNTADAANASTRSTQ
jgi:hypothetical protein